jgi:replication factor C small subunit
MWTEKYRPKTLDDVCGQDEIVAVVKGMLKRDNDIPNIRMVGEAGTGKTTIAYLIGKELLKDFFDMNFCEYNASNDRGVDTIREVIKSSIHQPLFTDIRIIFLDESDGLTPQAQDMLRKPLEDRKSTRYILSANRDVFTKPIRSRCVILEFEPSRISREVAAVICDLRSMNWSGCLMAAARQTGTHCCRRSGR